MIDDELEEKHPLLGAGASHLKIEIAAISMTSGLFERRDLPDCQPVQTARHKPSGITVLGVP